ncbi:MAG: hypothetical protein M1814_004794 [Vezdaea aestivalis]|nr:MAG: hypothetical protein M1814_004794 [Vezdaea aestivalis]
MPRHSASSSASLVQRRQQFRMERRFAICKTSVRVIYSALDRHVDDWQSYINLARSVMSSIDEQFFMAMTNKTEEQIWIVNGLQKLAYYRPDEIGLRDIADWAIRQWLIICEREPSNVDALQDRSGLAGMGNNWLFRAQPSIAAIERDEESTSSLKDADEPASGSASPVPSSVDGEEDEADETTEPEADGMAAKRASVFAQGRLCSRHYVEARGLLLPATEFYEKAVDVASSEDSDNGPSGGLLALAAEAFMSLGNVSFDDAARRYFSHALEYLQLAQEVQGYELPAHLKEYVHRFLSPVSTLVDRMNIDLQNLQMA